MIRPNHIVIDARESGSSTGRYVDKLIQYLQVVDTKKRYTLICLPDRIDQIPISSGNFSKVQTTHKKFSLGEQFFLPFTIMRLRPHLVYFPLAQQPLLYFGKTITGVLDLTPLYFRNPLSNFVVYKIKQALYWFVNYVVVKKSRHIITISNFVRGQVISKFHIKPSKITTTHNAADTITDAPEPVKELVGKKFIMYVGRPTPHKNLERLIDAYQILLKSQPDLHLVLAGKKDALMAAHEQRARDMELTNVHLTGFVSEGQLRWLYEHTAAYVFPSLSEGFGLPGLEAMNHGAPVISSNATCLPEVYGNAALYFDPLDTQDMVDKILSVLTNKTAGDNLRNKGYKKAKEYSWQKMAEQTVAVYESTLPHKV